MRKNGFQILILHPKKHLFPKINTPFFGQFTRKITLKNCVKYDMAIRYSVK